MKTTAEELNGRLLEKMCEEQEQFKEWLLLQSPEEILRHAYEYVVREDLVMFMWDNDLSYEQAKALLKSPIPLGDVYKEFERMETGYMHNIRESFIARANTVLELSKKQEAPER